MLCLGPIKSFLSPISKISDACILEIKGGKLSCLTCTSDNSIIFHIEYSIDGEFENNEVLNCPDVKKLIYIWQTLEFTIKTSKCLKRPAIRYQTSKLV